MTENNKTKAQIQYVHYSLQTTFPPEFTDTERFSYGCLPPIQSARAAQLSDKAMKTGIDVRL